MSTFQDHPKNPPPRNLFERLLRRFGRTSYALVVLLLYLLAATALAFAVTPALILGTKLFAVAGHLGVIAGWLLKSFALASGWFIFGLSLLVVVAFYNWILPTRLAPFKGGYYSLAALPWFLHNGLFYLVRYTFLPFVTLTPYGVWFLKAMGMKIGRHAFVNTEHISDPCLLTIGDDAVIGGSVRIFAHYGGGGNLVIAPVTVGHRATLGLACCVMGDVVIGDDAVILPESVLLPGSRVGAGETWGGVPARPISRNQMDAIKKIIRGEKTDMPMEQMRDL